MAKIKRNSLKTLALILGGGCILGALTADWLGLDPNNDWGPRRVILLAFGLLMAASPFLAIRIGQIFSSNLSRAFLGAGLAAVVVVLIYLWLSTAGTFKNWYQMTDYYRLQADGFLQGHLYLPVEPSPELLAKPDPYDPAQNRGLRLHDASLFNGKYYLYYGPTPALFLALPRLLFPQVTWGDQYLVFGFTVGVFFFLSALLLEIWRRHFQELSWWTAVLAVLATGLSNPFPWMLGRPEFYEAALTGGQCFLVGGIFWAFTAFEGQKCRLWRLVLAGVCWSLAVGSRLSLALLVVSLGIWVIWRIYWQTPGKGSLRMDWSALLAIGLPLALGAGLLLWYNAARFGSVFEFGARYQLAAHRQDANFSPIFSGANLFLIFLFSPKFSSIFPFISAPSYQAAELGISLPPNYVAGYPTAGMLWTLPALWLLPVGIIILLLGKLATKTRSADFSKPRLDESRWLSIGLSAALPAAMIPLMFNIGTVMRYHGDIVPILLTLSIVVFWQSCLALQCGSSPRRIALTGFAVLMLLTIATGFLLGINSDGYSMFEKGNPALFEWLVKYIHF